MISSSQSTDTTGLILLSSPGLMQISRNTNRQRGGSHLELYKQSKVEWSLSAGAAVPGDGGAGRV